MVNSIPDPTQTDPNTNTPLTPSQFPSTVSPDENSPGITGYAADIGRGALNGTMGFASSLGHLANSIDGVFGGSGLIDDNTLDDWSNVAKPKTAVGNIASGVTQFLWGFLPGLALGGIPAAGALGLGAEAAEGAQFASKFDALSGAGKFVANSIAGGISSAVGFDGHQQRLSNLIQQCPSLQNPVTDFLQARDSDSWAEARIKNALEGFGLGSLTDGLMKGLTAYKGLSEAVSAGDAGAANQIAQGAAADIAPAAKAAAAVDPTLDNTASGAVNNVIPDGAAPRSAIPIDTDALVSNFTKQLSSGADPTQAAQDAAAGFINHSKIVAPDDVHNAMQSMVNALKQTVDLSTTHSQIIQKAVDWFSANGGAGTVRAMQQDANFATDIASRFLVYSNFNVAAASKIVPQIAADGVTANVLDQVKNVWAPIASATQQIQTGLAQAMNSMAIVKQGLTPEVSRAIDAINQIGVLGTDGAAAQARVSAVLQTLGDQPDTVTRVFQGLGKLQDKAGEGLWEANNRFLIGSMLYSVKTQTSTLINNLGMTFLQPAQRMLGGAITGDMGAMASGARQYMGLLGSAMDVFRLSNVADNVVQDNGSALGKAFSRLTGAGGLDREGIPAGPSGSPGVLGTAWNWLSGAASIPEKMLDAQDTFFKEINARAYLRDEAIQAAQRSGISGDGLSTFISDYINSAYDGEGNLAHKGAQAWSEGATFTQQLDPNGTLVQRVGAGTQTLVNNLPVIRQFVPFIRTPTNILQTAIDYTPGLNLMSKTFKAQMINPATRADAIGKAYVGGLFWTLAAGYGASGQITGGGPQNQDEKSTLETTGWRPYSYVATDPNGQKSYTQYNRIDPFGIMFGLAADFSEMSASMDDQQRSNLASTMTMAVAKNLSDKTYFKGIQELVQFISGEKDPEQFFAQRAGEYIPTIFSNLNEDPDLHDIRSVMDGIKARIPGLSETLPPRRNMFGEPITPPNGYLPWGGSGTPLANALSPAGYSQQVDDPVKQELANLHFAFGKPSPNYAGLDLTKWKTASGQSAYDRMLELRGQVGGQGNTMADALSSLINSPGYQNLPNVQPGETQYQKMNNPRVQAINTTMSPFDELARYTMLKENPGIANNVRQQKVAAMTPAVSNSPIMAKLAQAQ